MALSAISKKCCKCKQEKPIEMFCRNRAKKDGLNTQCRSCSSKLTLAWRAKNKEKVKIYKAEYNKIHIKRLRVLYRAKNLNKKFGITIEEYDSMYIEQGGCCAICGKHQSEMNKRLAVDHCHEIGRIRGLLCERCNRGIGLLGDDVNIMKNAIKYIEMEV